MAKKFQLTDLKVTSFVTTLNENEQKTTKGGYLGARRIPIRHRAGRADWTELKTRIKTFSYTSGNTSSNSGGR